MSRAQPERKKGRTGRAFCALLLATSALALLRPLPLHAQETELRGEVSESAILFDQQQRARKTGKPQAQPAATPPPPENRTATYLPASAGAVPDDANPDATGAANSIFDPPAASDDPFGGKPPAAPPRRPSTAKARAADADKAKDKTKAADKKKPGQATDATTTGTTSAATDGTDQDAGNRRALTIDSVDRQKLDPGAERTDAIEGIKKEPEEDPYAATGIKIGSFLLRPSLEQGVTVTSNADSSSGGKSAVMSETALRFSAASDWRENSAVIDGYGNFRNTISGQKINEGRGRIEGTYNVDLDNELRAIAKLGYEIAPESASSPDAIAGVKSQPIRQTVDGSLGIEKDVGKLRFTVTGAVSHDIFGDAELTNGTVLSQKDRDSTLYTATLRTGYEISPAITPFAEVELGRRAYDLRVDSGGFERSSTRLGARAGVELDMGEKLTGEFSAGWLREAIDDDRLEANQGASVNADLKWSPERGTIIGLTGTTTIDGSTSPNESGDILYSGRLTGERQIRADLTGNAALGVDWRDYTGSENHDLTLSAEAGLTWWLNRYVGLVSRARTEKLTSNQTGRGYTANSIYLGLKLQR